VHWLRVGWFLYLNQCGLEQFAQCFQLVHRGYDQQGHGGSGLHQHRLPGNDFRAECVVGGHYQRVFKGVEIVGGIRVQALRESPDAFSSTYEQEAGRDDATWAARVHAVATSPNAQVLIACQHTEPCGLVWCKSSDSEPPVVALFQMWVAPSSRGTGAGRALLDEAIAWATGLGAQCVCLGVTLAGSPAMHLYQSRGFCSVGVPEPLREGSTLTSQSMELQLKRSR